MIVLRRLGTREVEGRKIECAQCASEEAEVMTDIELRSCQDRRIEFRIHGASYSRIMILLFMLLL